jgi:deazaflavin-dependent oxidoreductase (nitroreductase family)
MRITPPSRGSSTWKDCSSPTDREIIVRRATHQAVAGTMRPGHRPRAHTFFGFYALVLTTIDRKSGTERTTQVCGFPGKDGNWLIVAAAGGTAVNPAWYYNIAAHPAKVQIEIDGRTGAVTAEQLHGAERAEAWLQITTAARRFAHFQQKTDRELPVIRLMPRSGSAAPQD